MKTMKNICNIATVLVFLVTLGYTVAAIVTSINIHNLGTEMNIFEFCNWCILQHNLDYYIECGLQYAGLGVILGLTSKFCGWMIKNEEEES